MKDRLESVTLKTCPFCGELPSVSDQSNLELWAKYDKRRANCKNGDSPVPSYGISKSGEHRLRIKCYNCNIEFYSFIGWYYDLDESGEPKQELVAKARAKLLAKWNTRSNIKEDDT
tara:strand:- start:867 stop:1214 length:348 start_codon:yes stop_codon:yes gene_type:complete